MEEKKQIKVSLGTVFLVIAIILIVVMGALLYMQKTEADRQIAELENNASKLQEKIDDLQGKIDSVSNIGNTDTSNNNTIKIEGEYHVVGNDNSEGLTYKFEGNTVKFIALYTTEGTYEIVDNKIKITYSKAYDMDGELDTFPNGQYEELTIVDENTLTSQKTINGVVYNGKYVKYVEEVEKTINNNIKKYIELEDAGMPIQWLSVLGIIEEKTVEKYDKVVGDWMKTDIKYKDFKNEILKYITENMLESTRFANSIKEEEDGTISFLFAAKGAIEVLDIYITLVEKQGDLYTYQVEIERELDAKDKFKVNIKKVNDKYLVDSVYEEMNYWNGQWKERTD